MINNIFNQHMAQQENTGGHDRSADDVRVKTYTIEKNSNMHNKIENVSGARFI